MGIPFTGPGTQRSSDVLGMTLCYLCVCVCENKTIETFVFHSERGALASFIVFVVTSRHSNTVDDKDKWKSCGDS